MHRIVIALAALSLGCVPKARHMEALSAAAADLEQTNNALDACGEEGERLSLALAAARRHNAELDGLVNQMRAQNAELSGELSSLSESLADVRALGRQNKARKAELEAQLASMRDRSAESDQQVADAQQRIAALQAEAERLAAEKEALEQKTAEYDALLGELEAEIAAGQVTITELSGKLTVQLSNALLFDSGATALKKEGQAALEKVAGVLAGVADRGIRVEGHTDNVPVRASAPYPDNWALSALRAREVVVLLVAAGVAPDNVAVVGFGDQRPVADNGAAEGRAANRRTEIVLVPNLQQR